MSTTGRIVVVQAAIGLTCAAVFWMFDAASARSAVLALAASVTPSAYYAWVLGRTLNATRLLLHGVLKTVLTAVLVAVCIVVLTIEPVGFFVTLAAMQLCYLTGGVRFGARGKVEQSNPG